MAYVPVRRNIFEAEMTDMGFAHVDVKGTLELVYERKIPHTVYGVRILSTIDPRNGISRSVGTDAIRVTLWNYTKDRPVKRLNAVLIALAPRMACYSALENVLVKYGVGPLITSVRVATVLWLSARAETAISWAVAIILTVKILHRLRSES